jgi:long-chain fatty acid transport protein
MGERRICGAWALAVAAGAAAAAWLAPGTAWANAPGSYGIGSRGSAMGSAVAADVTDFSASYYNPAGLVAAPGVEISIGYLYADNRLLVDGRDNDVADIHGLSGGIVAPGKIFGIPFAFGLATYMPDDGLSRIQALRQEVPRWELYNDRSSILFLATNLAVRPLPWLEIGGGLAFLAATRGRFAVSGTADILKPYESDLRHEVDADLTSVRYPLAGLRIKVPHLGYIGLAYRGQTKLSLAIDADLNGFIRFAGLNIPLLYNLESRTIDAFLPQQVVLGASFQTIKNLHINLDVTWVNWAAYESPTAKTKAHLEAEPPAEVPLELPEDPKPTQVIPPEFRDRFVPRIGVELVLPVAGALRKVAGHAETRRGIEIPVRAGYMYEATPVPPQTGLTNFIDTDRHTVSLGMGVTLNAPAAVLPGSVRLDIHGMWSVLPERLIKKTSPADFIGDYRASGTMLGMGATLGASF